ncbi:hypothetical protein UlMin_022555 [Ulmus minor]
MTGGSLGFRTGSYGTLQQQNGFTNTQPIPVLLRKPSKLLLSSGREKEKVRSFGCRFFCRRKVAMLLLVLLALLIFVFGSLLLNKENANVNITQHVENTRTFGQTKSSYTRTIPGMKHTHKDKTSFTLSSLTGSDESRLLFHNPHAQDHRDFHPKLSTATFHETALPSEHLCKNFVFPPPPPADPKRVGPRPCPVCYLPAEQALARMPKSPSASPVVHNLTYILDENPTRIEPFGGSEFGGYPSLKQRNDSYDIKESMTLHCGFVRGNRPGYRTGFDIDEADLMELEQFNEVIVASAVFGNYDIIQQPANVSDLARKNVPFYMFIDEQTEAALKNSSVLGNSKRVGLWRIIVVHSIPYNDSRRNGKIPKLLLHRIFPNVRYSIWIDGKLQLSVDPYKILERFLWRENATFAISRHYARFDVFEEADANKNAGKYDNSSIDRQIEFYRKEGLRPYSKAKLPLTSDVPEGCVIIREHIPITNLFTCLWFNEVDRFTSRDQLSFSSVRDKVMDKVGWSINMFLDCERRSFVNQIQHRSILESMSPPAARRSKPVLPSGNVNSKTPTLKKVSIKRGKERRTGSRRHRKVVAGRRESNVL